MIAWPEATTRLRTAPRSFSPDLRKDLVAGENLTLTCRKLSSTLADLVHQLAVAQDLKSLFEGLKVFDTQHHDRRPAVLRHNHPAMLSFEPLHYLRKPILDVRQGEMFLSRHGHKYGQTTGRRQPKVLTPGQTEVQNRPRLHTELDSPWAVALM